jgi:hypothetical protein
MKTINNYYIDENNNKWNKNLFTREQIERYEKSLNNCSNCINCSDCSDYSR